MPFSILSVECEVFEITVARGYNETSFRDDLKRLYTMVGAERKKTVFLFNAAQVRHLEIYVVIG